MANTVILMGRLTRDNELKINNNGTAMLMNSIAVDRYSKNNENNTDFIPIRCFGGTAETISKYCGKGSKIFIQGNLKVDNYTDNTGNAKTSIYVIVDRFEFAESNKNNNVKNTTPTEITTMQQGLDTGAFQEIEDEDLPF